MVDREDILRAIQQKGPIVPNDITGELKQESYLIGAMLSELVANKKLRITHAKLGGSPLYYLETQKAGLSRLYKHLNEKDRRAYDILHRDIILYDEPQTPLMRTALRNLKDFAVPFKVTYKGKQLLYWRWYLASEDEVKKKVHQSLADLFPSEKKPEPTVNTEPTVVKPVEQEEVKQEPEPKAESKQEEKEPEVKAPEKKAPEVKTNPAPKLEPKKEVPKQEPVESQKTLSDTQDSSSEVDDEFAIQVSGFLNSMNIKILFTKVIKKKKEVDFVIDVPSPVGSVKYFAKARNKKRSNEGDVSTAFVEGQLQGLPVMYISAGDIPKKLDSIISEKYKNLKVLKL